MNAFCFSSLIKIAQHLMFFFNEKDIDIQKCIVNYCLNIYNIHIITFE